MFIFASAFSSFLIMLKKLFLLSGLLMSFDAGWMQAQTLKEWRDSLAVLNQQIRRYPKSTDLRLKKAAVNIELNQWDYALEEYSNVLSIDDKNLAALYYRAYVNTVMKNYGQARYDYERFLSIVPRHFDAQLGLAMVKQKMGRKTDALDELNRLVQMYPDSALSFAARAGYEAEIAQYETALFDWGEAIRLQPRNADFVASKVDILLFLKRNDEAREELEKAFQRGISRSALKAWVDKCK